MMTNEDRNHVYRAKVRMRVWNVDQRTNKSQVYGISRNDIYIAVTISILSSLTHVNEGVSRMEYSFAPSTKT